MEAVLAGNEKSTRNTLRFIQEVFGALGPGDFAVRLWDGTVWKPSRGMQARWTLVLKHPGALRQMLRPANQLSLGEAYLRDDFDIEGNIEDCFGLAEEILQMRWTLWEKLRFCRILWSLPPKPRAETPEHGAALKGFLTSRKRETEAVSFHYDISNDFYRQWLDPNMLLSCAYFTCADESLEAAQENKLDYLCRKLRLERGDRLLDLGCGWGSLILHAARHYGVQAHGITLSKAQAQFAQERIRREGLEDACQIEVCDYRGLHRPNSYDKILSMGIFEQVGEAKLPTYFEQIFHFLRPGGIFLNHGVASNTHNHLPDGPSLISRYVFPDVELIPIADVLRIAELTGFEVRDLESQREHYMLTLRHWIRRLENAAPAVRKVASDAMYRLWRLSMAGSSYGFRTGRINLYETLLVKPALGESGLPLTRSDWY